MSVGQYCNKRVSVLSQSASILDAAQLMRTKHAGEVVVVDHAKGSTFPVGIITDRDLVIEIIAMEVNIDEVTIGSIMCLELITVNEDDSLHNALEMMKIHGVRRAPVINASGSLSGIISVDGILQVLSQDMTKVLELFDTEQRIEKTLRS